MVEKIESVYRSSHKRPASQITPSPTGAGVILLENYRNKQGKHALAVILFRNKHNNTYQDGGGNIDPGETLKDAAVRELKEESANLFRLSEDSLKGCPEYDHQGTYRAYALKVQHTAGIQSAYYYENVEKLAAHPDTPNCWKETNKMARFYIDEIRKGLTNQGDLQCLDANGNRCVIFGRTKACIRELMGRFIQAPTVELKFNNNITRGPRFIHGTKAYY